MNTDRFADISGEIRRRRAISGGQSIVSCRP